jgi:hypothetical protein
LERDATGAEWLGTLLAAAPHGQEVIADELLAKPGELLQEVAVTYTLKFKGFSGPYIKITGNDP